MPLNSSSPPIRSRSRFSSASPLPASASARRLSPLATASSARHSRSNMRLSTGVMRRGEGTWPSTSAAADTDPRTNLTRTASIRATADSSVSPRSASRCASCNALPGNRTGARNPSSASTVSARSRVSAAIAAHRRLPRRTSRRYAEPA
nr:hypothetical protein GCM10020241_31300 [Streptoalloteichus tenebrarius]